MRFAPSIAGILASVATVTVGPVGCMLDSSGECGDNVLCAMDACIPRGRSEPVSEACGIFVSDSRGDDSQAGIKDAPVKTIARAIELASGKKNIYACAESFAEPIRLPSGMRLFGGLDCNAGWTHTAGNMKTTVTAPPDAVPVTLLGGDGATRIEDVAATAAPAVASGGSSIAMIADGRAAIVGCTLEAGDGQRGATGTTPTDPVGPIDPADPAIRGENGKDAATGSNAGGLGAVNAQCADSIGGDGGKGTLAIGTEGTDGLPALAGGLGGNPVALSQNCLSAAGMGMPGTSGGAGLPGAGGKAGRPGQQGKAGKPGQGGGGGGGAQGQASTAGASGGGGGAGGCGGKGGLGGQAGGSSIALFAQSGANLTLVDVFLKSAQGGNGGDGGSGQSGAIGGKGGLGGTGAAFSPSACSGGDGGTGGPGGKGGGGGGGNSIGLAYTGAVPSLEKTTITLGNFGQGGIGEGIADNGAPGIKGETQLMRTGAGP